MTVRPGLIPPVLFQERRWAVPRHVIKIPAFPPKNPVGSLPLKIVPVPRVIVNGYSVPEDWVIEHWMNLPKEVPPKKYKFKDRLGANGLDHLKKPPKPKPKKRGRPRKRGPSRKHREDPYRLSPSTRPGRRFHTITLPELAHAQLKEMALFYEMPISQVAAKLVDEAFARATEESELLARIEANREKDNAQAKTKDDPPDRATAPRRTHF